MLSLDQFQRLLEGAWVTVQVTALAAAGGTVVALALGIASRSHLRPLRWAVRVYVELFRGVSAIILLFWVFFALPLAGISLTPLQAGVLALGVNLSAYGTEIVRGALQAVPRGQIEAAIAVNLSAAQRMRHVVLPQAVFTMLPTYGNLLIEVLKASALVSIIALNDLMREAQIMRLNRTADSVDIFGAVLVVYFALALVITGVIRLAERRFGRGREVVRAGAGAVK